MNDEHTTSGDPTLWPMVEQAAAIAERRLGSEELLDAFLERIGRVDPTVRAVCTLDVDRARDRCRAADAATARGESWGPLHGLPFTIKDAIATEGIRSTGGAVALRDHVPSADAPAVAALKDAGAVVFGKTNLPEWSGDWQSFNEMFGTTCNPWDPTRTSGGSSGGAAAAVACGMTSAELGTDIGGSVRVPSAFCGVFGHKPTFGVIPTLGYLDEPNGGATESDVNTFGPIARDPRDLAVLLDALTAGQRTTASGWQLHLPSPVLPEEGLRGVRIGAWLDEPALPCDQAMADVLHAAVDRLEREGAVVDRTARPDVDIDEYWKLGARLIGAAVSVSDTDDRGPSHREWLFMHRRRQQLRDAWAALFDRFDVVVCPVTVLPAFEHLHDGYWATRTIDVNGTVHRYTLLEGWPAIVGAAYLPSTSVPVGLTAGGLPVGMQVVGPRFHDRRTIEVGARIAAVTHGYHVPPAVLSY